MRLEKGAFVRIFLGIAVLFFIIAIVGFLSNPEGLELAGEWKILHPDGTEEAVKIPFYRIVDNSGIYAAIKQFPHYDADAIMLYNVSNHGMRIYLNGEFLKEIGDFESGTANIWNYSHLVPFDRSKLKDINTLKIEMKVAYDIGIQKAPIVVEFAKVWMRNRILNFFINDMFMLAIGGGIVLGIVLLIFAYSTPKDNTHFICIAIAMLISSVYLFEFIYRETTGSVDSFIIFKKFTQSLGLTAVAFVILGVAKFAGAKRAFAGLIFLVNLIGAASFFFGPDLIALKKMQIVSDILFVLDAVVLAYIVFRYRKKYLFFSTTFLSVAIVYSVIAVVTGVQGVYVVGYGVIVATLGFGVALIENYRDIYRKIELIHKKSLIDPLTGAFNRSVLQEIPDFSNSILIMIDLDNFKEINDRYGHEVGDRTLVAFVEKAMENLRKDDIIVRYGGDEFLLILKNCDEADALQIMRRITSAIENIPGLKCSYGIARIENDLFDAIKTADMEMYKMKKNQTSDLK